MTDKQIIIDGVDVSGCPYYIDSECACSSHDCECIKCIHNVCFYKDYKAKEQECEKLKEEIKTNGFGCFNIEMSEQLDQLNAENESLKESLKMFSSTLDWALKSQVGLYKRQIDSSVPDDWEYEEVLVLVEQYIEKIKQTLAEIKEIAEKQVKRAPDGETFTRPEIKQILQKISECEVKND